MISINSSIPVVSQSQAQRFAEAVHTYLNYLTQNRTSPENALQQVNTDLIDASSHYMTAHGNTPEQCQEMGELRTFIGKDASQEKNNAYLRIAEKLQADVILFMSSSLNGKANTLNPEIQSRGFATNNALAVHSIFEFIRKVQMPSSPPENQRTLAALKVKILGLSYTTADPKIYYHILNTREEDSSPQEIEKMMTTLPSEEELTPYYQLAQWSQKNVVEHLLNHPTVENPVPPSGGRRGF